MPDLDPILMPDGRPYRYAARDWIGIETMAAVSLRGINAACDWTRRFEAALLHEHAPDGSHRTVKIPKAKLFVHPVAGVTRQVEEDSCIGTHYGATVASAVISGTDTVVTMAHPLGAGAAGIAIHIALPGRPARSQDAAPVSAVSTFSATVALTRPFVLLIFWG